MNFNNSGVNSHNKTFCETMTGYIVVYKVIVLNQSALKETETTYCKK